MPLRVNGYVFRPRLATTLLAAAGLVLFLSLGLWQLDRADEKQAMIDISSQRANDEPLRMNGSVRAWEDYRYYPAVVTGRYDLDHQVLLDNRTHHGRAGYHVYTPLRLAGSETAVLVNRGWVPVGETRNRLPELPGPADKIVVRAIINLPPRLFRLGPEDTRPLHWPAVVQTLEPDSIAERLGYPLLPVILQLDKNDEAGFVREWKPVYGIGPDKHRAYALQWFSFAVILLGIYLGINTRRIR